MNVDLQTNFLGANAIMAKQGSQSSNAAIEIADLMNTAVTVSQQNEVAKKAKAKEAKIGCQVKKMQAGNPESAGQEEYGGGDGTKWFQLGELGIMIDHLEKNYNYLFGNCKKASYKQQRIKAWESLMLALNTWNEQSETGVVRDIDSVKRKIDNMKQRGW